MMENSKKKTIEPFDTFDPFAEQENKEKPLSEEEINSKFSDSVNKLDAKLNQKNELEVNVEKKRDEIYDFLPNDFPYTNNKRFYKTKGLKFVLKKNPKCEDKKDEQIATNEEKIIIDNDLKETHVENKDVNLGNVIAFEKDTNKSQEEIKKEVSSWKFFISHKRFYIPLFFSLAFMIATGYFTSPIQRLGNVMYLVLDIVALCLMFVVSLCLIICIRFAMKKEEYKADNLMFGIIFAYIFIIGLILMVFFRLWALYNPSSILNKGGLFSLCACVISLLICLFVALYPFKRFKQY